MSALAQTNAAAMAVRQRVEGLQGAPGPEGQPSPSPQGAPGPGQGPGQTASAEPTAGKIDTRYIAPNASFVVVLRPAQILASPIAQVFPVEVASAAALKNLGFDSAEMDEVVAFVDSSNPTAPAYGATFKFKNPIRASSIPPERRAHAQLAELGGKKYLRSAVPIMYSLYSPNNKTLIVATDAALHQMVETANQPKSGPMMDRIRDVAAGSDLYLAIDVASLRPYIQMGLAQAQAQGKAPPEAKQYIEMLNQISGAELNLNLSAPGPTSFVVHCNDDAAAQKVESAIQEAIQKYKTPPTEQPAGDNVIAQAMDRYKDRVLQIVQPQRNGASITCLHVDGQNPAQQQFIAVGIIGVAVAALLPAVQAARQAARAQAVTPVAGPPGPGGVPASPEADQRR
jgi:hypothetical protein